MNERERQELEQRAAGIKAAEEAATASAQRKVERSDLARRRLALNDWPTPFRACPPRGLGQR